METVVKWQDKKYSFMLLLMGVTIAVKRGKLFAQQMCYLHVIYTHDFYTLLSLLE